MKISSAALVTFLAASTFHTRAFAPAFSRPQRTKLGLKPKAILTEDDTLIVSSGDRTTTISGTKIVTSVPEPKSLTSARASVTSNLSKYVGQTGASIVYSKLVEHDVSVVNGYSGGAILPLLDQFHPDNPRHETAPIRWITNSNEGSAGHVAEGYSKAGGKTGVVVATSGPGVTNLITPLQDAICDGVGMVVLAGQAATNAPQDAFQQAPAVALTTPCTKWSYCVRSAAELPLVMDYAFFVAQSGRPGPVFIDLPKDLQNQMVDSDLLEDFVKGIGLKGSNKDEGFIRFVEEHSHALHIGREEEGILFKINKQGLEQITNFDLGGKEGMYQDDHHPSNTVYKSNIDDSMSNYRRTSPLTLDSSLTKEMLETISQAERPIIVAGQGCNECSAELLQFAEKYQIPVATTLHGLGCFDERHPLALNMVGMHGHPTPNFMIQESDLLLCIGSRFDDRITGLISAFVPEAKKAGRENRGGIIHVDVRLSENAKQVKPTFFVHSSAKTFLETLNGLDAQAVDKTPWIRRKADLEFDFPVKIPLFPTHQVEANGESFSKTPLSAQSVVSQLNSQLLAADRMDDTVFSTGVGIHQMVAAQLLTWTRPRQMISSGSLGTMGVALGFVIGCKLNNDSMTCIAVDGDGSFNMTFTELKTVAEQNIPIKILILDNESQMMVEYWQKLFFDSRFLAVTNNKNPDYCTLADAFGIKNLYADSEEDLTEVMHKFLFEDPNEPVLMHVRIQKTPCLPLVAPGKPLQDMILEDVMYEGLDPNAAPG